MRKENKIVFDILLFLGFFGFLSRGTYVLILAFLFLFIVKTRKTINVSATSVLLIVFVLCDFFYTSFATGLSIRNMIFPIAVLLAFQSGVWIMECDESHEKFEYYYYLIAIAAASHGIINMFLNIAKYGFEFGDVRVLQDLWKTEDTLATGQGALFILLIGAAFYIYSTVPKKKKGFTKYILLVLPILSVIYNVMTATRLTVYLFFITIIAFYIWDALFVQRKFKKTIIGIGVSVGVWLSVHFNLFGVTNLIHNTALFQRITRLTEGNIDTAFTSAGRQDQVKFVMDNFSKFMAGGDPMGWGFVHNSWLSVLNRGGLVVAIPFLFFTIAAIVVAIKFMKNSGNKMAFLVAGFLVASYAYFFIEPVLEGARWLFLAFVFIIGMMQRLNESNCGLRR